MATNREGEAPAEPEWGFAQIRPFPRDFLGKRQFCPNNQARCLRLESQIKVIEGSNKRAYD